MRKLGLLIDQGKVGTTSMFFIAGALFVRVCNCKHVCVLIDNASLVLIIVVVCRVHDVSVLLWLLSYAFRGVRELARLLFCASSTLCNGMARVLFPILSHVL